MSQREQAMERMIQGVSRKTT